MTSLNLNHFLIPAAVTAGFKCSTYEFAGDTIGTIVEGNSHEEKSLSPLPGWQRHTGPPVLAYEQ